MIYGSARTSYLKTHDAVHRQGHRLCTKALKGHGDFQKMIVIWSCAIRSHGLVIRSLELDNSFSRIAIRSLELDNPFFRIATRSLELDS